MACHDGAETVAESSSLCRRLSEIVGDDLSSFLSFRFCRRRNAGCDRVSEVTQYDPHFIAKASWVRTIYSDKGENRLSIGFESAVCSPEGTGIES